MFLTLQNDQNKMIKKGLGVGKKRFGKGLMGRAKSEVEV